VLLLLLALVLLLLDDIKVSVSLVLMLLEYQRCFVRFHVQKSVQSCFSVTLKD